MKRLEFLETARQIACQLVSDSSCLSDEDFKSIMESDDTVEVALYRKAKEILGEASVDAEVELNEIIEFNLTSD